MMSTQLLHTINRIVEELSPEECKKLSYLCGTLDTERCAVKVRETLQSAVCGVEMEKLFLTELMVRMRRYDLLRNVLGISKAQAEDLLKSSRALSEYRVLMAELSEDMGSGDLESLVFLLRGNLPKEKVEKFECFLDVVVELEKSDQISSSRMDVMECYLRAIHRLDLAKKLKQYQNRAETPKQSSPPKNTDDWRQCRITPLHVKSGVSCSVERIPSTPFDTTSQQRTYSTVQSERQVEVYRMQSLPRGVCVIIDCVGNEGVHLEQLFAQLHFSVRLHRLLDVEDILSTLRDVCRQREHYRADAFVCCIISRTFSSRLLGTDSRGPGLSLDAVRQIFASDSCPGLAGKPKLFFIQGYDASEPPRFTGHAESWSYEVGELQTDIPGTSSCSVNTVPANADVFWSHCWTQEQQLEMSNHRSVYLQSLREALLTGQKRGMHLVDVHMEVNRAVYNHIPKNPRLSYHLNLRHTLRKHVCLS